MAAANDTLEPDTSGISDRDSGLGDDIASDTTSIRSWIKDYRMENGRRYHAFGDKDYWGPNDDAAQEHNDLAHELYTRTFDGKLCLASLPEGSIRVLDVGSGTGIWAIDFAEKYPDASVIGVDISPTQPEWLPANCQFEVDDVEQEWTYPENHFDYIHVRTLYGGIANWPLFYGRCLRHLKPGGIFEQAEYAAKMYAEDGTLDPESPLARSSELAKQCFDKLDRPEGELNIYETMEKRIPAAGFEDVVLRKFKWPIGTWPKNRKMKELGLWARTHLDMGLEGYMMRLMTTMLGMTADEVNKVCADVRAQMKDKRTHAIWPMNVVVAKKPLA